MAEYSRKRNYRIYLSAKAVLSLAAGIFGPFYILFVQQKGADLANFGIAMGILVFVQSITSYFAGSLSDIHGRKPLLVIAGFVSAGVTLAYLLISTTFELFVLQALSGILGGIEGTVGLSFLGDLTEEQTRGKDIGRFDALVGIVSGIAMMAGGYITQSLGIGVVFVMYAIGEVSYATLLLFTKENRNV